MGKFQSFSDYFPLVCQVVSCDVGPCFNLLTPNFNNHVHKQYLGLKKKKNDCVSSDLYAVCVYLSSYKLQVEYTVHVNSYTGRI